ncbi:MAG: oligosaccharide flippase family protein [Patescibacteria group bacterium]
MLKQKIVGSIDYAQSLLKIDLKYYLKSGFWISLSNFWTLGTQLLTSLAYANFLPVYVFGIYKYITSTSAILSTLTLTGMNTAVTQAVANGKEGTFKKSIKYQIKWNLLYLTGALSLGLYYLIMHNVSLGAAFIILGIIQPVSFVGNTYIAYLHGLKNFRKFSEYTIITVSFTTLATIASAYYFHDIILLLVANFGTTMIFNVFWIYKCLKKVKNNEEDREAFKYGRHLSYANVLSTIASYADYILVYHLLGPEQLAIYAFAILLPDTLRGITKNISQAAMPRLASADTRQYIGSMFKKSLILLIFIVALVLVYIMSATYIIDIFFPKYIQMVTLSKIYSITLLASVNIIPITLMLAKKKTEQVFKYTILGSIVQLISIIVLIPLYGLMGAVYAKILTHAVNLITSYVIVYSKRRSYEY